MAFANPASSALPPEVVTCLQNARFLHLATTSNNIPHISLMNYTYLPSTPFRSSPIIILTTPPPTSSKKTANLAANPAVSLLVHDWVSHRPPMLSSAADQQTDEAADGGSLSRVRSTSPSGRASSSLANLLLGMNTAALSRISVTLNGQAEILPDGSEEASWCKAKHLENNTFESNTIGSGIFGGANAAEEREGDGDGGAGRYIEGEDVRVVLVRIQDGRIADWKGRIEDWKVDVGQIPLTNGI